MKIVNSIGSLFFLLSLLTSNLGCKSHVEREDLLTDSEMKLLHYWDDFDFTDINKIEDPEIGEQKLVDFIAAFANVSDTVRIKSIENMLDRAKLSLVSFKYFVKLFEHYLYDPNSPMRNDSYYEPILDFLVKSTDLSERERLTYRSRLKFIRKNNPGMRASDFQFLLPDGAYSNLYELQAPLTLLFFYEPGCSFCEASIGKIDKSSFFQDMIAYHGLKIVGIYPYADLDIWKYYQSMIPSNWINGIDEERQILKKQLYDIRATPTIYLLDENKMVLLKDVDLTQLEQFLLSVKKKDNFEN